MRKVRIVALIAAAVFASEFAFLTNSMLPLSVAVISSAFLLSTKEDFQSLGKKYSTNGNVAGASKTVTGRSGVNHTFAFVVADPVGTVKVVCDTALSVTEVEETKVLGFYAKVFDVMPKSAILCVSPRLSLPAADLAHQYGLTVIESEKPRDLVGMLSKAIDKYVAS